MNSVTLGALAGLVGAIALAILTVSLSRTQTQLRVPTGVIVPVLILCTICAALRVAQLFLF